MTLSFRQFLTDKINYLISHFQKHCVLLDYEGNQIHEINLSFEALSDEYLTYCEEQQRRKEEESMNIIPSLDSKSTETISQQQISMQFHSININEKDLNIKINDDDLISFWNCLNCSYQLAFNIQGQNISDTSILKLAQLFQNQMCRFTHLKLAGNQKITQIGLIKLGQSLRNNHTIKEINLHDLNIGSNGVNRIIELIGITSISFLDLGLITNESLKYLAKHLEHPHNLDSIWFGETTSSDKWKDDGKQQFQNVVRRCQHSKRILAINVYPSELINHYTFISELNIITRKNRSLRLDQRENQFKAASLNPNHQSYYDPDNHNLNAYKFSVKSYLTNVFGSLLDQALYFLQKERRNQLRDEATFQITKEPTNKVILEDICTADGSIIVLTKYLLSKIKEKEENSGLS